MRRTAPRPLARALTVACDELAPATPLASVQRVWAEVAGPAIAGAAAPTGERDGVLTVTCESAVWAQELDLLSAELVERLNDAVARGSEDRPVRSMRCLTRRADGSR